MARTKDAKDTKGESLCWTQDEALKAIRAEQDEADAQLAELGDDAIARATAQLEAARSALKTARALRAANSGSDSIVSKAENDKAKAEHTLEEVEGRRIVSANKAAELRARAAQALRLAQRLSAKRYRAEALRLLDEMGTALSYASALNDQLRSLQADADRSFSWGSPECSAHGHAAHVGRDLVFEPLLFDVNGFNGGWLSDWRQRVYVFREAAESLEAEGR